jgi:hypothetical protein
MPDPCNFSDLPEEYAREVDAGRITIAEAYTAWQESLTSTEDRP